MTTHEHQYVSVKHIKESFRGIQMHWCCIKERKQITSPGINLTNSKPKFELSTSHHTFHLSVACGCWLVCSLSVVYILVVCICMYSANKEFFSYLLKAQKAFHLEIVRNTWQTSLPRPDHCQTDKKWGCSPMLMTSGWLTHIWANRVGSLVPLWQDAGSALPSIAAGGRQG